MNAVDKAIFQLMQWAVETLNKIVSLEDPDVIDLDMKVDLLNVVRDLANCLNNPEADETEALETAQEVADQLGDVDAQYVNTLLVRIWGG